MNKREMIESILKRSIKENEPKREKATAFAPVNIALCKYWGKRDRELNLPTVSSLSIALPGKGATTTLTTHMGLQMDTVFLNGIRLNQKTDFVKRILAFLALFRLSNTWHVSVDITMNVPLAAGLASSACGFAALVCALNELCDWRLSQRELSILARLGSGSASRSLWSGFVKWHRGCARDGLDSYAEPLMTQWPGLSVGLLIFSEQQKLLSSREAMERTLNTSAYYAEWQRQTERDLHVLESAIHERNFLSFGQVVESNALGMHATMMTSWPPICYYLAESMTAMHQIWALRRAAYPVYFTQDAGPNLKLLFESDQVRSILKDIFPTIELLPVF